MMEKHYGHTSNVASAAELAKGGKFKGDKRLTGCETAPAKNTATSVKQMERFELAACRFRWR